MMVPMNFHAAHGANGFVFWVAMDRSLKHKTKHKTSYVKAKQCLQNLITLKDSET